MTQNLAKIEMSVPILPSPGGRNNAFKHGGFSQDLVLADEKSEDFEQLLQSLIEEWSATGALEPLRLSHLRCNNSSSVTRLPFGRGLCSGSMKKSLEKQSVNIEETGGYRKDTILS
jgi:hypothetical protein